MIKINNNIILEIDGKFYDTFETKINNINNTNKKKYKDVTKILLKLQDIYGIEQNVNYILNEMENKLENNEVSGGNLHNNKSILINKKFLGGSWGKSKGGNDSEDKKNIDSEETNSDSDKQEGGQWNREPFTVQQGGQWGTHLEDSR